MSWRVFTGDSIIQNVAATAALVLTILALRLVLRRWVLRHVTQPELRLRWLANIRNGLLLALVLGLVPIWVQELRTFAVSIAAVAAAFVLATKELIQCVSGAVLRATGNVFSIGDRIEIGNHRGDVIDYTVLTTTILEIGPGRSFHMHTGRTITFPNSILLTTPVVNESSMEQYLVHVFSVPLRADEDWRRAERVLLEAAMAECGPFLEEARRHMERLEETHGFSSPSPYPRVAVQIADPGTVNLLVRVPAPVGRQGRVEQAILRRFLEQFYGAAGRTSHPAPAEVE